MVTATPIETFHVRNALKPLSDFSDVIKVPYFNQTYFVGAFGLFPAIHVQCNDMASHTAGGSILTASEAIQTWKPKAVIMIGIAMGIDETETKQRIGDVLVSESVIDYELQKLSKDGIIHRGNTAPVSQILSNRFKSVTGWNKVINANGTFAQILNGHILSGGKLIDNIEERNDLLSRFPHAIGKEMEGVGIFAACARAQIQNWIIVKGICDYGDGNKEVDKDARQNIAADSATSLCLKVFSSKNGLDVIGLIPEVANPAMPPQQGLANQQIVSEILEELSEQEKLSDMATPIRSTIEAYLKMSSIEKLNILKATGIPLDSLMNYNSHEMDLVFFQKVKNEGLLSKLWDAINEIRPFASNENPFK